MDHPKAISILGSTGSIGRATLDVIRLQPEAFRVIGLAAGSRTETLAEQIREFRPQIVSVRDSEAKSRLEDQLKQRNIDPGHIEIVTGTEGATAVAIRNEVELVVSAMVGFAGLVPTYEAILAGKDIALANKETLVAAGHIMMEAVAGSGVKLLPVDSEHNAIFQCLGGEPAHSVKCIWLTASGGPFFNMPADEFRHITPDQALRHPTWTMGPKITIDSATMMNKGLEVIEAHWLFGLPSDSIRVVVHPQSAIHSLVEFIDGSFLAQLGLTDMRLPISHALYYPQRVNGLARTLDLFSLPSLQFIEPDFDKFPCLRLAYRALGEGGSSPAVLSAANEIAVDAFLSGQIPFTDIPRTIQQTLDRFPAEPFTSISDVLDVDRRARDYAHTLVKTSLN